MILYILLFQYVVALLWKMLEFVFLLILILPRVDDYGSVLVVNLVEQLDIICASMSDWCYVFVLNYM